MSKVKTVPTTVLSELYKEFLKVFSQENANKLSLHYLRVDHTIQMQPGIQPPAGPLYSVSRNKLQVFKKYLEDYLSKRLIWASLSLTAALILFVKNQVLWVHMCCLKLDQTQLALYRMLTDVDTGWELEMDCV